MDVKIEESWKKVLENEFEQNYFGELVEFVRSKYKKSTVYPPAGFIFRAFNLTPFDKVKVVILGQDPYHGPGEANGLCFAVSKGIRTPPSLQNIKKEIKSDLGRDSAVPDGSLEKWAKEGVLLLNSTLTVEANKAGSHQKKGWEQFTDTVVRVLNENKEGLVFILWGKYAKDKGKNIDTSKHLVISSAHPSPFAAHSGFFGSKPFSKCNDYLRSKGKEPINW